MEDWKERNNGTQCAIDGSGWGNSLSDREYADRRRNQNRKIFPNVSLVNSKERTYHLERQHDDSEDGYAARKSLHGWFNNNVVRIKLAEVPRKEYKLLVAKGEKRKRCRSTIRRKRKERSGQDWDKDDDREYKRRTRAKRAGNTWKANETEIGPLGFINVPDQIWRNELSEGERDFVASYNARKQNEELVKYLITPRRFENLLKEKEP
eukprot:9862902-Ditylum_brightwellii.AAC.1